MILKIQNRLHGAEVVGERENYRGNGREREREREGE